MKVSKFDFILYNIYFIISLFFIYQSIKFDFNIFYILLMILTGFTFLKVSLSVIQISFTPIFFFIAYVTGYQILMFETAINQNFYPEKGWGAIANFNFTSMEYNNIILQLIFIGAIQAFIFYVLYINIKRYNMYSMYNKYCINIRDRISVRKLRMTTTVFFIFSILVLFILNHYSIGMTGLKTNSELPFKLGGFMNLYKKITIPVIMAFLYYWHLKVNRNKIKFVTYLFLIIIVYGAVTSLSRMFLIVNLAALVLIYIIHLKEENQKINKHLVYKFILLGLLLIVTIEAISIYRILSYSGYINRLDFFQLINSVIEIYNSPDRQNVFMLFLKLISNRITGSGVISLMSLQNYIQNHGDINNVYLLSTADYNFANTLFYEVFNVKIDNNDTVAKGFSFGFFSSMFLSGSYIFVFISTFVVFFLIYLFEIYLSSKFYKTIKVVFSFILFIWVSSMVGLLMLLKILIFFILSYYIVNLIFYKILLKKKRIFVDI
jgi:hypothetical protein